jgi:UDP-N-acetylglucosamine 4-epimerase
LGDIRNIDDSFLACKGIDVFSHQAAVIPLFIIAALTNTSPLISVDGAIVRNFIPVTNVIQANSSRLLSNIITSARNVINITCGNASTLKEIWLTIKELSESISQAKYGNNRQGDIFF